MPGTSARFDNILTHRLKDRGLAFAFEAALNNIEGELHHRPTDYEHRRQALKDWASPPKTWLADIIQPHPQLQHGTFETGDRKRLACSAYVWARVTQGEYSFAPTPCADRPGPPAPGRRLAARHGGHGSRRRDVAAVQSGASTQSLPPAQFAVGSAINQSFRQLGAVLGVSLFAAVVGTPSPATAFDVFHHIWWVFGALGLAAGLIVWLPPLRRATT
ncbi:hypothetical protein ACWCQN_45615 [Streptomyces sp. NPDC001984]|uniref:hypothetical protein n=1 Tax=Streptomyces sp. NPDC002619 TaxID=3364655 RepID=UPI0036C5778A